MRPDDSHPPAAEPPTGTGAGNDDETRGVNDDVNGEESSTDPPDGFDDWRRRSALGAVGTGVARGLQAVFAPPVDEPVIVASVPGEPPDADTRLRVVLDPDDPSKSVAIVPESPGTSDQDER